MGAPYALRATAAPAAPAIATPWSLPPPPPADLFDDPRGELSPPLLDGRLACRPPPRLVLAITPDSNSLSSFGKGLRVPAVRTDASPDAAEVEASVGRRSPLPLRLPPPLPGRDPRILAVAAGSTAVDADPGAALDLDSRTSSSRMLGAARGACADLAVMAAAAAVAAADCCADLPDALAAPASSLDRVATAPTPAAAAAPAPARALLGGPARLRLPPTLPGDTGPGVDDETAPGRLAGLAPLPLCLAKTSLSSESVAALAPAADPAPPATAPAPPEDDRSATAPGLEAGRAPLPLCLARTSCSRDGREARAAATAAGLPLPPGPEGLVGALPSTEMAPTALLPEPTAPPPPAP